MDEELDTLFYDLSVNEFRMGWEILVVVTTKRDLWYVSRAWPLGIWDCISGKYELLYYYIGVSSGVAGV